jgi:membrane-bound ClpP family serine protease
MRRLNHSFCHGVAAYSALASAPIVHSNLALIMAGLTCVYAGWFHGRRLAAFLGGIIVAVAGWTTVGILGSPEVGVGIFSMVPFALLVILPEATAAYVVGRVAFTLARRNVDRTRDEQ